jgi:NAD(P)-dependent dehydrogenase (short-subunit alcohol dehydrogenase family)
VSPVAVVTGSSAGVGRAVAVAFARRGWRVGLLARGTAGLEGAEAEVRAAGGEPLAIRVDVADPEGLQDAAERFERELGPIDVWVNNAMATVFAPFTQVTPEEFRRATEVTYLGTVWGTMAALRVMRPRDRGTIVQVGSALAYRGIPLQAPYCGAKHAIQGFTESVRCELLHEHSGVHLTMVQLPAVNTPQFSWGRNRMPRRPQPVPPIYQPEVVAEAIVRASQMDRKELDVGGSTLKAIIGDKVASATLDRYLARTAYEAQQTDEPADGNGGGNLFEPHDEEQDMGVDGRFADRSRSRSFQLWLNVHRRSIAAAAAAAGGALVLARRRDG